VRTDGVAIAGEGADVALYAVRQLVVALSQLLGDCRRPR